VEELHHAALHQSLLTYAPWQLIAEGNLLKSKREVTIF